MGLLTYCQQLRVKNLDPCVQKHNFDIHVTINSSKAGQKTSRCFLKVIACASKEAPEG